MITEAKLSELRGRIVKFADEHNLFCFEFEHHDIAKAKCNNKISLSYWIDDITPINNLIAKMASKDNVRVYCLNDEIQGDDQFLVGYIVTTDSYDVLEKLEEVKPLWDRAFYRFMFGKYPRKRKPRG